MILVNGPFHGIKGKVLSLFLPLQVMPGQCIYNLTMLCQSVIIAAGHDRLLIYKLQSKHTSNSGFDQTFMSCLGYILFAAEQRVGYQISWVDLQREVNCP